MVLFLLKTAKLKGVPKLTKGRPEAYPGCDLAESVTFDGRLMTYHRNSEDLDDCGLRFKELYEASVEDK